MLDLLEVSLRPAATADAEGLALLHVEVWEQAYAHLMPAEVFVERRASLPQRVERWRATIASSPARTTVAEHRGRIIGFASVGPPRDADSAAPVELWALYVHADCWGAGVGHLMMSELLADRPAYLWVLEGNDRAASFYHRHGFVADGAIKVDDIGRELRMTRR